MIALAADPRISGFTTNPTLMRQAGDRRLRTLRQGAHGSRSPSCPISFEVISDDFAEMERQALACATFGDNVYVKIPITDTSGR